jgi:hypothetical protein
MRKVTKVKGRQLKRRRMHLRVIKHICQNHGAFTNFRTINKTIKSSSEEDVISGAGDINI